MKELLRTIQHRARNNDFEIRVYREGDLYIVEAYHGDHQIGEPQSVPTTEDGDFHTYHGKTAVETFISSFIEQIDQGETSPE